MTFLTSQMKTVIFTHCSEEVFRIIGMIIANTVLLPNLLKVCVDRFGGLLFNDFSN